MFETSPDRQAHRVFAGVALAIMLGALEITLLMPAISSLGRTFDAPALAPLLVSGYLFTMTLTMPVYGRLSDRFGRLPCLLTAIALFILGSMTSVLADSLAQLLATRLLTGLGGGGLIALSFAVIADVIPPRQVGRYQGLISTLFAVSSVAGPLLGAALIARFDWRWLFLFKLPLGVLAMGLCWWALQGLGHRGTRSRPDHTGMVLLVLAGVAWGLSTNTAELLPALAPWQPLLIGSALLLSLLLLVQQWRHPHPVLPLRLLRERLMAMAVLLLALSEAVRLGLLVYLPLALEQQGQRPEDTSRVLLWFILSVTAGTFVSGKRIAHVGYCRPFPWAGGLLLGLGCGLLWGLVNHGLSGLWLYGGLIAAGVGIGFLIVACSIAVQNALPASQLGAGLALMNFCRSLGGTLGVIWLGWQYQQQQADWSAPVYLSLAGYGLGCLLLGFIMPDRELGNQAKNPSG
ncbi:MFS transporter [Oceanimonas sp. NS1]|uniref:MFS transporter n=1 Tax=Oceanimonas sp. MB9 TaxID=2588453 RepID=UPI0013F62A21|nr:MFS transporter [Oceanimonas sp. MB9]MCT7654043.1 MFS transporter [Oceanimonas sp. NS1]NHH99680.1 Multidrug resistance protein 3 [Oceanimonas sp. MB9]